MHLIAIKEGLREALQRLTYTRADTERQGHKHYVYSKLGGLREAVDFFNKAGILSTLSSAIRNSDLYSIGGGSVILQQGQGNKLEEIIDRLRSTAEDLLNTLDKIVDDEGENVVHIKLPEVKDFQELAAYSKELQTILGQIVLNPIIDGKVQIVSFENGSLWIQVYLGNLVALNLIARVTRVASNLYQIILQNQILTQKAREAKLESTINQQLLEHQSNMIALMVEVESQSIMKEFFEGVADEKEFLTRVKNSINGTKELMSKGAEIYPALNASKEVKGEFANMNLLQSLREQLTLTEAEKDQATDNEVKENK